ncbi:hypothetical protein JYA63_07325 [Fictibacillus nanhaiensis]|uniref:Uncharacterized protein n=1 Tax=Fictibacillus nanhaiensis TaxID=742169 RepID=A0ABS2ZRV2_9BACL|nr:hypothetical protein [Fictibacillus nanhaiensis]
MNGFKFMPKCIKKAIRYIYQDAPYDDLIEIRALVNSAIEKRLKEDKK